MSKLFLKDKWQTVGAKFSNLGSYECVSEVNPFEVEYSAMREGAVFSDMSFVKMFAFDESDGFEFLDSILAGNVLKLRYGKVLNTFLANEKGEICAECFVGNVDDKILLLAESTADEAFLDSIFAGEATSCANIGASYVLLAVDGPLAWKIPSEIFGADVLSLPYLGIEKFDFEGDEIYLLRNGKTGEFGYQFIVPNGIAEKFFDKAASILPLAKGVFGGTKIQFNSRLEGGFFNIYAEGARIKNPLELGLQWQIDFSKQTYCGSNKINSLRKNGINEKLVCISALTDEVDFLEGEKIFCVSEPIGEVVATAFSQKSNRKLALALLKKDFTQSGFDFSTRKSGEIDCSTISRPAIVTLSLLNGLENA